MVVKKSFQKVVSRVIGEASAISGGQMPPFLVKLGILSDCWCYDLISLTEMVRGSTADRRFCELGARLG